jgi:hypothetical protein
MKISTVLLCVAASSIAGGAMAQTNLPSRPEHGIPDAPTLLTNVKTTSTGSMLKRRLRWKSTIPLNKTYEELTPEQKAEFHSLYVSIPEGNEPPYPVRGLSPVFKAIQQGQDIMQARGELDYSVTVDPDGKATYVESHSELGGVNAREMSNYVASVFMMAKYKPAVCQGKPCTMQFPFKLKLD